MHEQVLYARGPWRVVATTARRSHVAFAVLDTAGACHFEAAALEPARDWVDVRLRSQGTEHPRPAGRRLR